MCIYNRIRSTTLTMYTCTCTGFPAILVVKTTQYIPDLGDGYGVRNGVYWYVEQFQLIWTQLIRMPILFYFYHPQYLHIRLHFATGNILLPLLTNFTWNLIFPILIFLMFLMFSTPFLFVWTCDSLQWIRHVLLWNVRVWNLYIYVYIIYIYILITYTLWHFKSTIWHFAKNFVLWTVYVYVYKSCPLCICIYWLHILWFSMLFWSNMSCCAK